MFMDSDWFETIWGETEKFWKIFALAIECNTGIYQLYWYRLL